jgi:RNA polymerase sigma factor (sigma-70 family)
MGVRAPWAFRHELPVGSDEQLTDRAREGDQSAYGELYRRHRKAAESTAWCLLRSKNDADDVVADAFAGVLSALRNGRGPRDNFRRYLLACVRNGCRVRRTRTVPIEESSIERLAPVLEEPEHYVEANTVARAFAALTPRWQHTLWLTEVEQRPAREVSERMHLSPNATAALAHRARQAFATAYLAEHVSAVRRGDCVAHAPQLAGYVRGALTGAALAALEHHLVTCRDCAVAAAELRDVNASLRSIAMPGQLLAAGAAAASGSLGAATVATVGVTGSAATATAATGVWTAISGASMLVKGLVAILLVAPAISAERPHVTAMSGTSRLGDGATVDPASSETGPTPSVSESAAGVVLVQTPPDPNVPAADEPAPVAGAPIRRDKALDDVPTRLAPRDVEVVPVPVDGPVIGDGVGAVIDGAAQPAIEEVTDSAIGDILDPVIEPVIEAVVEPVVQGLDEALAMMGLGSTGETVQLLRSLVPLLDGPLVDLVLTDLLGFEPSGASDAPPLTELLTGLQVTDGSEPLPGVSPESHGSDHAAGPGSSAAQPPIAIGPPMPSTSPPAVAVQPGGVQDTALPAVVLPAITLPLTVDLPPVQVLDVAIIDLPAVEVPAVALSMELPVLDLPGLGIPPLTLPGRPQ